MTLEATAADADPAGIAAPAHSGASSQFFRAWYVLPAVLLALLAFLMLTPDGTAEPLQDFAGWLVIGGVATLAVMAIVTVLDRLLDCEGN